MGLHEEIEKSREQEDIDLAKEIQSRKDDLFMLRKRRELFEDKNFIWFFTKYIHNPKKDAEAMHLTCEDTNKNFILKGKLQGYSGIIKARAELLNDIKQLEDDIHHNELSLHEETEDRKPLN